MFSSGAGQIVEEANLWCISIGMKFMKKDIHSPYRKRNELRRLVQRLVQYLLSKFPYEYAPLPADIISRWDSAV
jgi:hypothetical protein